MIFGAFWPGEGEGRCLRGFLLLLLTQEFGYVYDWFLYAALDPPAPASEREASVLPLGEICALKEPTGSQETPTGLKKGWSGAVTSLQHAPPGRALSVGMFTRYSVGCLCPGFKLIPVWKQFNCADVQLSLSLLPCPQQGTSHAGTLPLCSEHPKQLTLHTEQAQKMLFCPLPTCSLSPARTWSEYVGVHWKSILDALDL